MADEADLANDHMEQEEKLRRRVIASQPTLRRIGQCYNCEESFLTKAESAKLKQQIADTGIELPVFEPESRKLFCDCDCEKDYTKRIRFKLPVFS